MKSVLNFFLFTSLYIALCAVLMVYQTFSLILEKPVDFHFAAFVFFSTICSYNFHWALTPHSLAPSYRLQWDEHHKRFHFGLSLLGLIGSIVYFFFLSEHWFYIGIAGFFTFLYSAPKISFPPFQWLKKVAIGKTVFLAVAWAYVTAALPILTEGHEFGTKEILYCTGQYFYIYAICILFDFRDREDDKADGIRSMITYFNEKGIDSIFAISVIAFITSCILLFYHAIAWINILILLLPAFILISLYKYSKRNFSDYHYYFVLDGLMMLSGLILLLKNLI